MEERVERRERGGQEGKSGRAGREKGKGEGKRERVEERVERRERGGQEGKSGRARKGRGTEQEGKMEKRGTHNHQLTFPEVPSMCVEAIQEVVIVVLGNVHTPSPCLYH